MSIASGSSGLLGDALLRQVLHSIQAEGGEIREKHGELLLQLSFQEMHLLQLATELVDKKAVKKVTSVPSQRVFYRVESLNLKNFGRTSGGNGAMEISKPYDASVVSGHGRNYYNVFDHYCTCEAFLHAATKSPTAMCKHIVALLLAEATNQCIAITIQDVDYARMLCPSLEVVHSDE